LESEEYSQWLTGPSRSLFCSGIPGAGKTYLASRAIDDLQDKRLQPDVKIGLAWIYCDYATKVSQTVVKNISSLLKQLLGALSTFPQEILHLYKAPGTTNSCTTSLNLAEYRSVIQIIANMYTRVFIVVDALDECENGEGNRDNFIKELQGLPENVRLLVTSRPIEEIRSEFADSVQKDILAHRSDIEVYISGRLKTEKWLSILVERDRTLPSLIENKVIEHGKGM
jgi:hypothetical protein